MLMAGFLKPIALNPVPVQFHIEVPLVALTAKAIVLFGSVASGTYHEESDIDIFIHGKYKLVGLYEYEKKLGHEINLLFEEDLKQLSKGLLGNIYEGQLLAGELEVPI